MVEQLKFLAFLTSSKHYVPCTRKRKPLRVLARCGQAINYLALGSASPSGTLPFLFLLWRLRTLPDADKQVNLLAFLFLLWRLRTLLS